MLKILRVLIVEDSADDAELILRELGHDGYSAQSERVDNSEALHRALDGQTWDIVISDYVMPRFSGLEALWIIQEKKLDIPFIIVTGAIGEDMAVAAIKAGAHDYIMKDRMARLGPAVGRALDEAEVRRARHRAEERLRYLAYFDPLTELPNLAHLHERLAQAYTDAQRDRQGFALLMLNINRFREVNEALGHDNGDVFLQQVARRLQSQLRRSDMAARVGADEFALLLYPCGREDALARGQAILAAFEQPLDVAGLPIELNLRLGAALAPDHGASSRHLLQHADVALSLARRDGAPLSLYDPLRDPSSPKRLLLMGELRAAIGNRQLMLHFQPKVNLRDGAVCGAEALARWEHPELGRVPPDEFIPLAEKSGLIHPLTLSVLETAVQQARAWRERGWHMPVAVNLSVRNMLDPALVKKVEALLIARAMEANMLEIEITESALMEDPVRALDILTVLNAMGIQLSIDDFGTGYSSLAYLKKLPVTAVKIDKSFVLDMISNADSAAIVHSTIDLAHSLGLKVVAEGVENKETLERLTEFGCDEAQGYFIGRPMPEEEMARWLKTRGF
ncbi:MAG: GGDEF domain-containing response regulator [Gammaproteobacteria bacterium]|nr:MAG: GGDEF domain-containing response regulator [Gammaproteobacteria bacterium]